MPIHNRQDFHAIAVFREPPSLVPALRRGRRGIDKACPFIIRAFVAQRIGQLTEDLPPHFSLTPLLEPAMEGVGVRIALPQQGHCAPGFRIQSTASKTARVGMGLRPGRLSGMCSSGTCSRIRFHCSSRSSNMEARIRTQSHRVNNFEIGPRKLKIR